MPNGGSDCCGTCWFNRKNRGDRDSLQHTEDSEPHHCEIRDVAIDDPFSLTAPIHPHRRAPASKACGTDQEVPKRR